ncbi:YwqJ-related putative deaminase, partial [Streptomyces sp. NPDC058240]|uniref:YwqJ-related putative deaminase n=1 Tax=Streptomyces sp. NPDC058240 TaxID=3346396 RepID=UPI0036E98C6A
FGGWDAMGQAWKGLAQLATGLAISAIPGASTLFWALPDDKLPSWLRDSRTAMKETGKALVAWDEWGKNPGRAAGAVTFNVLTTVFTGGAGGAAAGAGKAGAVAKVLSVAGKAGKVIDPMTYIAKGAGAGLSKIGDITKGLKGISNIEIPKLPDDAITLPEGSLKLPDGTVHLPDGAPIPEGGAKLPDGTIKFPDDAPLLPENTTKLPTHTDIPVQYFDHDGNLLNEHGDIVQKAEDAPAETSPDVPHTDNPHTGTPHTDTPVKEPALVGVGAHTADNVAHVGADAGDNVIHLGSDLGDTGRIADDLPGGHTGDNLPGGNAGNHLPGAGAGDHLPGGHADDLGHHPTAGHEPPANNHTGGHGDGPGGPHDPTPPHHSDHTPNSHADDAAHHGADEGAPHHGSDDVLPHDDGVPHDPDGPHSPDGPDGPDHPGGDGPGNEPHGKPLEPQPDWHGQSADKMRHYRRPALDVSHLPLKDQLPVLEREASALADDALDAPPGAAHPGQNQLDSGCAGSFLHDNTITAHSSTTKMHGQTVPHTHKVLDGILKQIDDDAKAGIIEKKGNGHGKCAEISLISDRLSQLDPTGTSIRTVADARQALEGGIMHTRRIGDFVMKKTGEVRGRHGDFLPPCDTCTHVLPQLGIRVHA